MWRWSEGELARCYYQKTIIIIRVNKSCNDAMHKSVLIAGVVRARLRLRLELHNNLYARISKRGLILIVVLFSMKSLGLSESSQV